MCIKRFTLLLMTQSLLYSFVAICTGTNKTMAQVLQQKGMCYICADCRSFVPGQAIASLGSGISLTLGLSTRPVLVLTGVPHICSSF